jgi:tripartite-type tricarboxylate transporter receptor subunit TctC
MNNIHRRKVLGSAIGLLAATTANLSWAQNEAWPTKPIQLILGFPPGGPNDLVARALALRLSDQLKQQVVVENRAGANGNIAAAAVARAAPDGQTFLYNSSALALSSVLYTKNQIDPRKDLLPVNGTAALPLVLIVEASFPASNFREWAAQVRANPGKFNYGSPGAGNLAHVAVAMILQANGLDAVHAPYKGSSEALQGLIGGSTQFQLDSINSPLALIKSGRIKPLFVTSSQRSPVLPEVQTLVEGGSSPIDAAAWQGVMAPAKTPSNIVQRMATEISKAMASPEMKSALAAQGAYSIATTPERYNTFFLEEIDRYKKTVDALGLKLD